MNPRFEIHGADSVTQPYVKRLTMDGARRAKFDTYAKNARAVQAAPVVVSPGLMPAITALAAPTSGEVGGNE